MSELSPDARALISQARTRGSELLGPSAAQRAQMRARLTPLWAAGAAPPRASTGLRWKLGSFAIIAGLGLLGWMFKQPAGGTESVPVLSSSPLAAAEEASVAASSAAVRAAPSQIDPAHGSTGMTEPQAPCVPGSGLSCQPRTAALPALPSASVRKSKRSEPSVAELAVQSLPHPAKRGQPKRPKLSATGPAAQRLPVPAKVADSQRPALGAEPDLSEALALIEREPSAQTNSAEFRRARAVSTLPAARLPLGATEDRTAEAPVRTDPVPVPPSIDGELELLGAAQTALQRRRPTRALNLLQEHAFRFPTGAMSEERMAMQALALCTLQRRHAARTVLSNLAARGSQSPLLPRVRSQCGL